MIEWHYCKCGRPCSIVPLSLIFDSTGEKFGGVWYCQLCRIFYTNQFLSPSQIEELRSKNISVEKIDDMEGNK